MRFTLVISPQENDSGAAEQAGQWARAWVAAHERSGTGNCVRTLIGQQVTRSGVEQELPPGQGPDVVAWYGHGTSLAWVITGLGPVGSSRDLRESIVDPGNCRRLYGRATYAVACWTWVELGRRVLKDGPPGTAYVGYDGELPLPRAPAMRSGLGEVVNAGLSVLHDRGNLPVTEALCWGIGKAVQGGCRKLMRSVRHASPEHLLDCVYVGVWLNAFHAGCVSRPQTCAPT